jgi:hypothetical protein
MALGPRRPDPARVGSPSGGGTTGIAGSARLGCAIAALAAAVALTGAAAQVTDPDAVPHILASNGVAVPTPDIAALDCDGMAEALRRIDQSKYREQEALSPDHPDWPIFDYENRLARSYYADCLLLKHAFDDPGEAFSFGFAPE